MLIDATLSGFETANVYDMECTDELSVLMLNSTMLKIGISVFGVFVMDVRDDTCILSSNGYTL